MTPSLVISLLFFFNDTATTEIYTLSLHDALPISLNEQGEELRDVLVLIGGEGPLRPMLEGLIRSLDLTGRVRLLGFIPEEYLPRYYQAADLMLLPTAELEGFGLVTDRKSTRLNSS